LCAMAQQAYDNFNRVACNFCILVVANVTRSDKTDHFVHKIDSR